MADFGSALWNKPASVGGGGTEEGGGAPADPVTRSLRFNDGDNSGLYIDPTASHDSSTVYTFSCWAKLGKMGGTSYEIFTAGYYASGSSQDLLYFGHDTNSKLRIWLRSTVDATNTTYTSTAVFRDPAAWYHLTLVRNGASLKVYVNNSEVISETISSTQRYGVGGGLPMHVGVSPKLTSSSIYSYYSFDGLLADVYFTDGHAKSPTDFIESNNYGGYKPKKYTGDFGTNGFHIDAQPAHDADLLVSSIGRNDGDTTFADAAQGHGLTVSGDTEHSIAVGNPFTGDDRMMYLNGDYLSMPHSSDWTIGSGDATIEFWIKTSDSTGDILYNTSGTSPYAGWLISIGFAVSGRISFFNASSSSNEWVNMSAAINDGLLHHVAVVKDGTSLKFYLDGNLDSSHTLSYTGVASNVPLLVGKQAGTTNRNLQGHLYDIRIVNGTAVYSGEFTPPSGKLTTTGGTYPSTTNVDTSITSSHTVLLIQPEKDDTDFHDESDSGHTITTYGTPTRKASSPYEAAAKSTAIHFDGSGDYITTSWDSASDFDFGSSDYTIECWFTVNNTSTTYKTLFGGTAFELNCFLYGPNIYFYAAAGYYLYDNTLNNVSTNTWYHVACQRNGNTLELYFNGDLIETLSWSGTHSSFTSSTPFRIGYLNGYGRTHDGYIYDFRVTKGEAKYSGSTYDTPTAPFELNPVYLGGDQSGNKNHFTPTNISQAHDVMLDVPTNNYCTLNPLDNRNTPLSEGNLRAGVGSTYSTTAGTFGMESGKWIWSCLRNVNGGGTPSFGLTPVSDSFSGASDWVGSSSNGGWAYYQSAYHDIYHNASVLVENLFSASEDEELAWAVDIDAGKAWLGTVSSGSVTWYNSGDPANGTNATFTFTAGTAMKPTISSYGSGSNGSLNFGQDATYAGLESPSTTYADSNGNGSFGFQPPSGFLALCSDNLDAPSVTPTNHFDVLTYNGAYDNYSNFSGTSPQTVTGTDFTPEIVWIKDRDNVSSNYGNGYHGGYWFDNVMGTGYALNTDLDNSSHSGSSLASGEDGISSFNSNGFTVDEADETNAAADSSFGGSIDTYERYVAWCWKLGTTASSWSGSGQDPDSEKYNASAGVSIIDYYDSEYGGSAITLNHSLGAAPEFAIAFDYEGYTSGHYVWHKDLSSGNYLTLSSNSSQSSDTDYFPASPATATTFTLGTSISSGTQSHVALFSGVEGYSKFGKYTGNGSSDGAFIYTGFRPAFILIKRIGSSADWVIRDTARDTTNVATASLSANSSSDEGSYASGYELDILSNGFKPRSSGIVHNSSSSDYIYAAFAESPFSKSNAR
ncbi:MAG: hypothetical protein CMM87_06170 [Rickettsiales bacterium]|nr:hypothetical protein [Rickettsiales bacterium]